MNHNTENPVTFQQACRELNVSAKVLSAYRSAAGITSRIFMLSQIRQFIADNPKFSVNQYYSQKEKTPNAKRLEFSFDGRVWVVTMPGCPDLMAQDKVLSKALQQAGRQVEAMN